MQRKIKLMTEFIQVFQVVDPGLTKWRGKMLYQLLKTKMFLSDVKHSKDILDSEAFKIGICHSCDFCIDEFFLELEDNLKAMEEVVECLKYEPRDSSEYKMSRSAEVTIVQIKELLNMMCFVKFVP